MSILSRFFSTLFVLLLFTQVPAAAQTFSELQSGFSKPIGLAIDDNLYVVDAGASTPVVKVLDLSTNRISAIYGDDNGEQTYSNKAYDADLHAGNLYVSDGNDDRVYVVDPSDGSNISTIGDGSVAGEASFDGPAGLAFGDGNLYVVNDNGSNQTNIVVVNPDTEEELYRFGINTDRIFGIAYNNDTLYLTDRDGYVQVIDVSDPANVTIEATYGDDADEAQYDTPNDVTYFGDLYVSNDANSTIDVVDPADGSQVDELTSTALNGPYDMTFDASGTMYVANNGEGKNSGNNVLKSDSSFPVGITSRGSVELAEAYQLSAASPNPFNPQTHLTLTVAQPQHVRVAVYDALGRRVAVLHRGALAAGQAHRFTFEAEGLPSGLYLLRAQGETFAATRKLMLAK